MTKGAPAERAGLSQAEPKVSALRASIPSALLALAERCEAAEGPDDTFLSAFTRKRLIEAWDLIYPTSMCWDFDEGEAHSRRSSRFFGLLDAGGYLDAAQTLVPGGVKWHFDSHYNIAAVHVYAETFDGGPAHSIYPGEGATPALALCAAALRAHAQGIEAGTGETGTGSTACCESPVANGDAPNPAPNPRGSTQERER